MDDNAYRSRLFTEYHKTHDQFVDFEGPEKLAWFVKYVKANYLRHFPAKERTTLKILDIGCNNGYLLAALDTQGFNKLYGVDLSPDDVEKAKRLVPRAIVTCENGLNYMRNNREQFDLIIFKAVLEHLPKKDILPFLNSVKESLKPGGTVIIDVPNMDWIFAQHERYMDFTHELGFTRESLSQVLRSEFNEVRIFKGIAPATSGLTGRIRILLRGVLIKLSTIFFVILGEGAANIWWDCRSIVGICKK